jgi:hypothetical protein
VFIVVYDRIGPGRVSGFGVETVGGVVLPDGLSFSPGILVSDIFIYPNNLLNQN